MIITIPHSADYEQPVPDSPSDLGFPVPGDVWWPGQKQTVGRILFAYNNFDTVLLNAPTGSGKTLIVAAVIRLMDIRSIILTHTIALQNQYLKTAPWAVTMAGKRNFPCGQPDRPFVQKILDTLHSTALTTEDCDDYLDCESPWRDGCSYFAQLGRAADADMTVLNYAYAMRIIKPDTLSRGIRQSTDPDTSIDNPFRRELLVCDEGHLANNAIVDAESLDFWHPTMRKCGIKWWPEQADALDAWQEWARYARDALDDFTPSKDDPILRSRYRNLKTRVNRLHDIRPNDAIVEHDAQVTHVRPLWARSAYYSLFAHFPKILVMSATLGDPELLTQRLGLDREDRSIAYIDVPSSFPKINRPVYYWPVVRLNAKSDSDDYAALAGAIKYIVERHEGKGIVHVSSYKLVKQLRPFLGTDDRFILHEQASHRDTLVNLFVDADEPYVIVTPSLATGFDYSGVSFQIIAKVPFPDLGSPLVRARREYALPNNPKFGKMVYDDDTQNQVIQAAGRAVRSPTDTGITYILDSNWWSLFKRTSSPMFFKEVVQWL